MTGVTSQAYDRYPDNGVGQRSKAEQEMLRIPFDGPNLEGRRAVVSTGIEKFRGIVVQLDNAGVSLAINGTIRDIPARDIRVISPA